ncbi:MAG: hypothetical protein EA398_14530 [Deltaproteobacteria bacterium]|nr:MAG: hypothetical protein EA398_14530 [Deltaproteobacteria bacterium]
MSSGDPQPPPTEAPDSGNTGHVREHAHTRDVLAEAPAAEQPFDREHDATELIRGDGHPAPRDTADSRHDAEFVLGGTVPRNEPSPRVRERAEDLYLRLESRVYGPIAMGELESLLSSGLLTGYETISGDLRKWTPLAYHPRMIASRDSDPEATHRILEQYSDLPAPSAAADSVPTSSLAALLDEKPGAPAAGILHRPSRIGSRPATGPNRPITGRQRVPQPDERDATPASTPPGDTPALHPTDDATPNSAPDTPHPPVEPPHTASTSPPQNHDSSPHDAHPLPDLDEHAAETAPMPAQTRESLAAQGRDENDDAIPPPDETARHPAFATPLAHDMAHHDASPGDDTAPDSLDPPLDPQAAAGPRSASGALRTAALALFAGGIVVIATLLWLSSC